MTVLSAQSIQSRIEGALPEFLKIDPWEPIAKKDFGLSYGLTSAGYDIRIGQIGSHNYSTYELTPGHFILCSSLERVKVPTDLQVIVHDKSTWARKGLALQNTVLEPGWEGYITLELSNHGGERIFLQPGMPIAQLIFHQLDLPTTRPYIGKYQNQGAAPVHAIHEEDDHVS